MINYDTTRGSSVTVQTDSSSTQSRLTIYHAVESDTGNYTCSASNTKPASIYVFVTEGTQRFNHFFPTQTIKQLIVLFVTFFFFLRENLSLPAGEIQFLSPSVLLLSFRLIRDDCTRHIRINLSEQISLIAITLNFVSGDKMAAIQRRKTSAAVKNLCELLVLIVTIAIEVVLTR